MKSWDLRSIDIILKFGGSTSNVCNVAEAKAEQSRGGGFKLGPHRNGCDVAAGCDMSGCSLLWRGGTAQEGTGLDRFHIPSE